MMNCQQLLLKRGLKGKTDNSVFKGINGLPEMWQNAVTSQETISKNDSVIEILLLFFIEVAKRFDRPSYRSLSHF